MNAKAASRLVGPMDKVMITGHRDIADMRWLLHQLNQVAGYLIRVHAMQWVVSGLALRTDTAWARVGLERGLKLWAHIPFPQQAHAWSYPDQIRWHNLRDRAAKITMYAEHYDVDAYGRRNQGMVDAADLALVVWDGRRRGGTYHALRYACYRRPTLDMIHIDPKERTCRHLDHKQWRALLNRPAAARR